MRKFDIRALFARFFLLIFLLAPVRAHAVGWTPTDGGLVVNLKPNDQILISVMVDHDDNPSTPDREYFVENYTRYTGDDYFKYDAGYFLKLVEQEAGATAPSEMSIWTVDTALTRVDATNVCGGGKGMNYALGGISYTIWNDGKTLKTATDRYKFFGDLEGDHNNDRLCDAVFVIPTARPGIESFDPANTMGRGTTFNGETNTGFLGMTYREVYWLEIPRFNVPVSYTNAAIVTFNTSKSNKTWAGNTIKSGRNTYAYADTKHNATVRTIFRLYILNEPIATCPDSYFFAYDEQDYIKYRRGPSTSPKASWTDSTDAKKIYTMDRLFCMDRVGETQYYQTGLMYVPVPDSSYYYIGWHDDYRNGSGGTPSEPLGSSTSRSQFTKIRQLPMLDLTGKYAPAGACGRMVADTMSAELNLNVKFDPAGYFFQTNNGVNVEMRQVDENTWMVNEMWYIDPTYMDLQARIMLYSGPTFSTTDKGVKVEGWSEFVDAVEIPVVGGGSASGQYGWARIHTNQTSLNGGMEFVVADHTKCVRYHNNGHFGADIPDQHPEASGSTRYVKIEDARLIEGYEFKGWAAASDGDVVIFPKDSTTKPLKVGDVIDLNALPAGLSLTDGVLHLYAIAVYKGTINVAISFVREEDGKRYFLTHPQLLSPRFARARTFSDWTEVRQGMRNPENNDPNYISSWNILGNDGVCKECEDGEYVLDPHREVMRGGVDSLVFYEDYSPNTEEYLGLYYTTPNTIIANSTWAGLFKSSEGWPTPANPCIEHTYLSSTHYLDRNGEGEIERYERSNHDQPNIVYDDASNQFNGIAGTGTEFMISGVGVVDAHYVILPDTTVAWRDEITFDNITEPHPREQVVSKLIGKQLLAQMKVGNDTIYFHPNRDKTITSVSQLRLSSDYRLTQSFTLIPDARAVSVDEDDRPSMEIVDEAGCTIIGGHENPMNVTYQGNYIDIVDTLRITLSQGGVSKIKKYYGRWDDKAVDSVLANGSRYRDIIVRTKTYHYGATRTHLVLAPEKERYAFNPLAGNSQTINFTLTKVTSRPLLDAQGNVMDEEVFASEDITTSLRLASGACSFASGGTYFSKSEVVNQHVTLATIANNSSGDNLDTLIISMTVRVDGVDYPATARVPLVQTSLEGSELIWSVYEGGKRYYIMAGSGGLIFRLYRSDGNSIYKEGNSNIPLKVGSANEANNDKQYITPWHFDYNPEHSDQLKLMTKYGVNRYLKMLGEDVDSRAGVDPSLFTYLTYHYVNVYINDNANEEEQVKLQVAPNRWLQFTLTGGSGAELKLVADEEHASVFSWSYLNREYRLLNNGTYPSTDSLIFGYNSTVSADVQTRYMAYKEYSMLVGNKLTYLCREEEDVIATLRDDKGEWLTDISMELLPDARDFDGSPDPVSGLGISTDALTLTTTVTPGSAVSPTGVTIDGKYVNIVDTLHVTLSLQDNAPEYRFAGEWSGFKSVDDAELKIPLIRKTYHVDDYDSLACLEVNEEYNHVFPNVIDPASPDSTYTFVLATKKRTGDHVLDVYNNSIAVISAIETDVSSSMHLNQKAYAEIQLIDEVGNTPTWCRISDKDATTISVTCTQNGIRTPRTAYIYIAYIVMLDDDDNPETPDVMRFVNYRLTVTQPSLFDYGDNQRLIHSRGASGEPLDPVTGMQQVHENKRILYYYPDQDVELPVRESHFFGWWRWFREGEGEIGDSDIPEEDWRKKPANTGTYNFPFRTIGSLVDDPENPGDQKLVTMGRYTVFHYRSKDYNNVRNNPPVKTVAVAPPTVKAGIPAKPTVTYAVDISNYYDKLPMSVSQKNQVDVERLANMLEIPEPTLSIREVFDLHPWTEMAERMESYKSTRTTDDNGEYPLADEHYMEDHVVMAPLGNQLLLPTEQRYNLKNIQAGGHSESLLGYYMRDDNWSSMDATPDGDGWTRQDSMIWCAGWDSECKWYTYNPTTKKYTPSTCKITTGDDFLIVPAKNNIPKGKDYDTVYYCLRARSMATTGTPGVDEDSNPGAHMFNICRYMVVYHRTNKYGPLKETGTGTAAKALLTNDEIEQRYEVLERLNFDYNQPGSEYTIYPHPLPWADASYGYTYPETPDLPHNRLHDQTDLPNFGEYGLINRIHYTDYWHDMEQHGGAANGYMIYCDGMSSSGQVAALSLSTHLCAGQKMFFSCYVGNPSSQSNKSNPNFTFDVQGSENGTDWENITSYMTGDIKPSTAWYQIYFPIIFNAAEKDYAHFRVRIYNMSSSWDGNDFVIDDMCLFATKPPLIAYQANTTCKDKVEEETPTHVILRVDYQGITGEGYNDNSVYYTLKCVNKERVTSFVKMEDHYLAEEKHPGADVSKPDTLCGKIYIPGKTYAPSDVDSIFVNMNELIDTFDVSNGVFKEGYIYEILEGVIRPVKYIVHSAFLNPKDTFTVHMSAEYKDLLSSLCGMTSYLKVSNQMVLELNGEELADNEQTDLCANATYDIGLRVKGSLYLDSVAPINLNGSCVNDWLLYGDTAEATSEALYGYKYSDIVKVVKEILRCEPPGTTNANQFAPNLAAVSHNEMLRIQEAQRVEINGTIEPVRNSKYDPYVILSHLVNKGFLTLYQPNVTATVYAGDSVQYVIFPILGTGNDEMHNYHVEVCPLPILIKLKPDPGSAKAPLIVGGLNRDASEMNQPVVVLAGSVDANHEITLHVDSIMPLVGIRSVELLSTDDPGFREGVHSLAFVPDLDYPAEIYYVKGNEITLRPASSNNYYMKPGYTYTYGLVMETILGKDTLDGGCKVGTVPFKLSVVPNYLRWDPQDESSYQWNQPGNWMAVDEWNQPVATNARFAPLAASAVIIPPMTDGRPYPVLPDLDEPLTYDSVKQVGFTYNSCDAIRFLPGAAISQQQRMTHTRAIVDMPIPYDKWAFRSAPVTGMLSGDLFMSNADINYGTMPWEVGAFDANGRNYNTGTASFWLSLYSRETRRLNKEGEDSVRTADAAWSKVTNGMTLPLMPAQGWAVYTRTKSGNAAAIRLPKNDDVYYYYGTYGEQMDRYEWDLIAKRDAAAGGAGQAGKLAYTIDAQEYALKNDNEGGSASFVFGNPTMGYIDIWGFIDDNCLREEFHYMDESGAAGIYTSVVRASIGSDVITNCARYLPPMRAIVIQKADETAAKELDVTLNANRIVTDPSQCVASSRSCGGAPAPKRMVEEDLPKGIMTITATNSVSPICFSRLLLGQGYHAAIRDGEDAVLATNCIDNFSMTNAPATPFNIYAVEGHQGLNIDLRDSIFNVPVSFYLSALPYDPTTRIWFTGVNNITGPLVFYDALTDTEHPIADGVYIDIETPQQSHVVRYYIRRPGYKEPTGTEITTSFVPALAEDEQAVKYVHNGVVYILRQGHVYTMFGQKIR